MRAGFVVNRAVGGAVVRNRVRRCLRHLVAARVHTVPAGTLVVVRALPPSASASTDELAHDLDIALDSAFGSVLGSASYAARADTHNEAARTHEPVGQP